jgi:triacylglycerol lipase
MYVPKAFNFDISLELGNLILQAYAQFQAFENNQKWGLKGEYDLIKEFYYTWTPTKAIEKGMHGFDMSLVRIRGEERNKLINIPFGFAAQRKNNCYLVFRGTLTVKEWVRNFSMKLSPYLLPKHGNVHEGFLETFNSIRNDIDESLSVLSQRTRIHVGGHSLGAAISTLALPYIEKKMNVRICSCYTFGSPRVGDDTFVKAFNSKYENRSFRIANTSDIVTSIPFPAPIFRKIGGYFSHVEASVDINVQKEDIEKNHNMNTYLEELREKKTSDGFLKKLLENPF